MAITPIKVVLFLLGGTVAAGGVGYMAGAFDPAVVNAPAKVAADADSATPKGDRATAPATAEMAAEPAAPPASEAPPAAAQPAAVARLPSAPANDGPQDPPATATDAAQEPPESAGAKAPTETVPPQIAAAPPPRDESVPAQAVLAAAAPPPPSPEPAPKVAMPEPASKVAMPEPAPKLAALDPADGGPRAEPPTSEPPRPAPAASEVEAPGFDLMRVEADGSIVIAGHAAPNAKVEAIIGSRVIGSAQAGPEGDFAIVLDEPLKPGDYQIVLRATNPDGIAAMSLETAVVSIPETADGQVLALVEQPGKPAELITVPRPGPGTAPADKVAAEQDDVGVAAADSPLAQPNSPPTQPNAAPAQPNAAPAQPDAAAPAPPAVAPAETEAAAPKPVHPPTAPASDDAGAKTPDGGAPPPATQDVASAPAPKPPTKPPAGQDVASAPAWEPAPPPSAQPSAGAIAVEAVEIEGRRIFIAGTADAGLRIRAYANDILLGETIASAARRFLVETERSLPVGDYIIRVDALGADGVRVLARAAVPFQREPGENLAAVAPSVAAERPGKPADGAATDPARTEPAAAGSEAAAASQPKTAEDSAGAALPPPSVTARSDTPAGVDKQAAAAQTAPRPKAAAADSADAAPPPPGVAAQSDAPAGVDAQAAADASGASGIAPGTSDTAMALEPAEPVSPSALAPAPQPPSPAAAAAVAETPAASGATPAASVPAMSPDVATPASDLPAPALPKPAADGAVAMAETETPPDAGGATDVLAPKLQAVNGSVIIRRGDSLWRISRRVYGRGVRYSTIYLANQPQIRDPNRIYPGQIFGVPTRTTEGEAADMQGLGEQAVEAAPATARQ